MKDLSRRRLLMGAAIGGAVLVAGCATTHSGNVTSITLNVAKVTAYATAGLNAAQTVETALLPFPALTAYVGPLQAATALLQTAVNAFSAAVADKVTVSYSDASIRSLVDSVLTAIEQIAGLIGNVVTALVRAGFAITDGTVNKVQLVHDALATIVSVFRALLTSSSPALAPSAAPRLAMSEGRALSVLAA